MNGHFPAARCSLAGACFFRPIKAGTRGGGRTHNLRLRRPTLYPIELLAQGKPTIRIRAPLLKWNLQIAAAHCGRRRLPGGHRPPLQNTHCLCAQKQKGTARGRPGVNVCHPTDYCCGGAAGGGVRARGVFATRRRAISAFAHDRLRHFLPLVKLLRRQNGFHLRGHVVTNGLHLGTAIFRRKAGVGAQVVHLLVALVHDGLTFGFWSSVRLRSWRFDQSSDGFSCPVRAGQRRSAGGRSGRRRVGVTRAQGRTPHQQTARGQCRD